MSNILLRRRALMGTKIITLKITTQPTETTVKRTFTAELTCFAQVVEDSSVAVSYQWYETTSATNYDAAAAISGATSPTYSFAPSVTGTFYYFCRVSAQGKTVNSNIVAVTATPYLAIFPGNDFLLSGNAYSSYVTLGESSIALKTKLLNGYSMFAGVITSDLQIDFSQYKTLYITKTEATVQNSHIFSAALYASNTANSNSFQSRKNIDGGAGTVAIDISDWDGKYYFGVYMVSNSGSTAQSSATITNIWLE